MDAVQLLATAIVETPAQQRAGASTPRQEELPPMTIPPRISNVTITTPDGATHHVEPVTVMDEETGLSRVQIPVGSFLRANDTLTVTWDETVGDDLCEYGDCQNRATHTESWYDEEGVDARVCDDHGGL